MSSHPIFDQIQGEIPGYAAAAIGTLSGARYFSHAMPGFDLESVRPALLAQLQACHNLYEGLGGPVDFGSNDEVLMAATKGYLLCRMNHEKKTFVAVLLKASGNIGYLRFKMRDYLRAAD